VTSAQDLTSYRSPGSTGPVGSTGSGVRVTQGKRPGLPGHMPTADRSSSAGEEAPALCACRWSYRPETRLETSVP
jgi:hypothetical protein